MENTATSTPQFVRGKKNKATTSRKYWSRAEEEVLIVAIKELIVDGWKAGNGWRPGFYKQCAKRIRAAIPNSDVQGEPHVQSKIAVWKKDYGLLSGVFSGSGQELDPADYSITILGTPQWEAGVKVNKDLEKLRNKSFPYYEHWREIWSKDRANGSAAQDPGSTADQILQNERNNLPEVMRGAPIPPYVSPNNAADNDSNSGGEDVQETSVAGSANSRKRKSKSALEDESFSKTMSTFMLDTKEALRDLSNAIRSLKEVDPAVGKVFAALEVFQNSL